MCRRCHVKEHAHLRKAGIILGKLHRPPYAPVGSMDVVVRLSEDVDAELTKVAARMGLSKSALVRMWIMQRVPITDTQANRKENG